MRKISHSDKKPKQVKKKGWLYSSYSPRGRWHGTRRYVSRHVAGGDWAGFLTRQIWQATGPVNGWQVALVRRKGRCHLAPCGWPDGTYKIFLWHPWVSNSWPMEEKQLGKGPLTNAPMMLLVISSHNKGIWIEISFGLEWKGDGAKPQPTVSLFTSNHKGADRV